MAAKLRIASTLYILIMLAAGAASSPVPSTGLNERCLHGEEDPDHCHGNPPTPPHTVPFTPPVNIHNAVRKNGIYLGMYPNPSQTLCELEGVVQAAFAFHGIRVQLKSGQLWRASEVASSMVDLQKTKAILQLAIVPDSAWWGLVQSNDCQAVAIAKEIGKIRQKLGRPVWLNFAPGMNCMSPPANAPGFTKRDQALASEQDADTVAPAIEKRNHLSQLNRTFANAWQLVYNAVMAEAPDTRMIWSPAPANDVQSYRRFWPADAQPHIVGMSYEPTQTPLASDFRGTVKPFHDEFASSGRPLLLTRTAPDLNQRISESRRISFLDVITDYNAVAEMPYYFGAVYYNFKERTDKRVIILKEEGDRQYHRMNAKMKEWVQAAV